MAWQHIGLILLGAGRATRFGSDKLAAPLADGPMIRHTAAIFRSRPFRRRIAVLGPAAPSLQDLDYVEIRVEADLVQSGSLAAGVAALGVHRIEGVMVALGDMPLVTPAHLDAMLAAFDGIRPVCSAKDADRMPPAIFPIAMRDALLRQNGDRGAKALLSDAVAVAAAADVLLDIDTPSDLDAARRIMHGQRSQR